MSRIFSLSADFPSQNAAKFADLERILRSRTKYLTLGSRADFYIAESVRFALPKRRFRLSPVRPGTGMFCAMCATATVKGSFKMLE